VAPVSKDKSRTYRELAEDWAARYGERTALVSERETFTYREWNGRANRYARWAASQGIGKGDVVALLMPNRPEYLSVWLGIAKIGGITALLNTHLVSQSLAIASTASMPSSSSSMRPCSARSTPFGPDQRRDRYFRSW